MFEGDTITYRGLNLHRSNVKAYVEKYPEGANVLVYYDPTEPANSVLEPGVDKSAFLCGAVVVILLFSIGIVLLLFELRQYME